MLKERLLTATNTTSGGPVHIAPNDPLRWSTAPTLHHQNTTLTRYSQSQTHAPVMNAFIAHWADNLTEEKNRKATDSPRFWNIDRESLGMPRSVDGVGKIMKSQKESEKEKDRESERERETEFLTLYSVEEAGSKEKGDKTTKRTTVGHIATTTIINYYF